MKKSGAGTRVAASASFAAAIALAEREGVRRLLAGAELDAAREAGIAHVAHTLFNTSEFLSLP